MKSSILYQLISVSHYFCMLSRLRPNYFAAIVWLSASGRWGKIENHPKTVSHIERSEHCWKWLMLVTWKWGDKQLHTRFLCVYRLYKSRGNVITNTHHRQNEFSKIRLFLIRFIYPIHFSNYLISQTLVQNPK